MVSDGKKVVRMQDIEQQAIHTYQENLQYLKEHQENIFKKISILNQAIELGQYQENYELEYKDEGYFDLKELGSQEYLYKTNSNNHANNMLNIADKKRSGGVFRALKQIRASDSQAEIIDKSELSFHNYLWAIIKPINYVHKYVTKESYMRRVYKVIFIRTGLGLHIEGITKKLQSKIIFIKEGNLEIFRLSLFVTDYKKIAENNKIYFSIMENTKNEETIFKEFLNHGNNYNLNIKHIPFDNFYKEDLQQLQKYVLAQSFINYGYSAILLRYLSSPKYLVQNYNFLDVSRRHLDNIFSQKPVLLLMSGPSTSNNIEWIKANHDRFIVVSALSTCTLLSRNNIKPNVVIHMDPGEATAKLFEEIDVENYFKDINIILAPNVTQDTVNRFKKSQISFIEQGSKYKKDFGILTAPSVGEYSYGLSLILGSTNVYMLGIDLALDQSTLSTHGDFHFANRQAKDTSDSASLDMKDGIHYTKGNFSDKVASIAAYQMSIDQFSKFTNYFKLKTQNVYNLSNGAYLDGSKPLHLDEFDWSSLEKLQQDEISTKISNFFLDIGSNEFRDVDKDIILYQIKVAKKLKKEILNYQKKKHTDAIKYLDTLAQLSWNLSDMDYKTNSDLSQVYYEFFLTILSYIYDLFNTQELKNPKKHIVEINKILIMQLLKIANTYIEKMESYL